MAGARKAPYRLRRDETIVRGPVALMKRMVRAGMRIRMVLGRARGHLMRDGRVLSCIRIGILLRDVEIEKTCLL